MREILFRGKQLDNGEWVEGFIVASRENTYPDGFEMITVDGINYDELESYIPDFTSYAVDPDTVGQYTGMKDKNGKKIFEGDIVDILTENEEIGVIEYDDGGFQVEADGFIVDFHANINGTDLEVIGNVHDNPELLEK